MTAKLTAEEKNAKHTTWQVIHHKEKHKTIENTKIIWEDFLFVIGTLGAYKNQKWTLTDNVHYMMTCPKTDYYS